MVRASSLAEEIWRLRHKLERERAARLAAEAPLERALELLGNCVAGIASNDQHFMQQVGAAAGEFLEQVKAKA